MSPKPTTTPKKSEDTPALAAAVKAVAGSSVNVTDDGRRLRVTTSAAEWDGLWAKLAKVKPLTELRWENCEHEQGQMTAVWVR